MHIIILQYIESQIVLASRLSVLSVSLYQASDFAEPFHTLSNSYILIS